MRTCLVLAALVALVFVAPVAAGGLSGKYVEARTCDVWTGACFANAEMNLTGHHAVMAWRIDQGTQSGVKLDGLSVVAVVEASDTLGLAQTGPAKAVLLVDEKATSAQREALIAVAKKLGGDLTRNVIAVKAQPISVDVNGCKEGGCARVDAGIASVATRCLKDNEDKACGHEDNFYPPLAKGLTVKSTFVTDHTFTGKDFNKTWKDARRGGYVGSFEVQE